MSRSISAFGGSAATLGPVPAVTAFESDAALLDAARLMLRARQIAASPPPAQLMAEGAPAPDQVAQAWSAYWHNAIDQSETPLSRLMKEKGVEGPGREVLALLLLERLGFYEWQPKVGRILNTLSLPVEMTLKALDAMGDDGILRKAGLIAYDDNDCDLQDRELIAPPSLTDVVLKTIDPSQPKEPTTEAELIEMLDPLVQQIVRKTDMLASAGRSGGSRFFFSHIARLSGKIERGLSKLKVILEAHPEWGLSKLLVRQPVLPEPMQMILLLLMGKAMGQTGEEESCFTGRGLAFAASARPEQVRQSLNLLRPDSRLLRDDLVVPAVTGGEFYSCAPESICRSSFALSDSAMILLGLEKTPAGGRFDLGEVRKPRLTLDNMVLSPEASKAIELILTHSKNMKLLNEGWGLSSVLPYGRGLTLLLSGAPGCGKTATAEALAQALGKPLVIVDWSRVQSYLVGEAEKNLVKAFRQAKALDGVLFFDEFDTMALCRDDADRSWFISCVNILLVQIEQFEGICVMSTNRAHALDPALERRISLKIELKQPDRMMRERLWWGLIPEAMPLAQDVNLDVLAEQELTGGLIKNCVITAARLALQRNTAGPVTMQDFQEAVSMEVENNWSDDAHRERMGFSVGGRK